MKKTHISEEIFRHKVVILAQPFVLKKGNDIVFYGDIESFEDQNPDILVVNYNTLVQYANQNGLYLDIQDVNEFKDDRYDNLREQMYGDIEESIKNTIKTTLVRYAYVDADLKEWFVVDQENHENINPVSYENKLFNLFIVEGYHTDKVSNPHIIEPVIGCVLTDYTSYLECQNNEANQNFYITNVKEA